MQDVFNCMIPIEKVFFLGVCCAVSFFVLFSACIGIGTKDTNAVG